MIYGYARCSTNEKEQDINRQVRELKQYGATDKTIYLEYESGMKTNRAELAKLLDVVKPGDSILATEVSCITRSTKQLCDIIELAKDRKIKLVLGSFVVDCTKELDPMTEGMLKMMGVFSELERNMISQRVKSGMENAKAKGKTIGRPPPPIPSRLSSTSTTRNIKRGKSTKRSFQGCATSLIRRFTNTYALSNNNSYDKNSHPMPFGIG